VHNQTQKNHLSVVYLFFLITICFSNVAYAQPKDGIGNFDIEKVRRAVTDGNAPVSADSGAGAIATKQEKANVGWLIARICLYLAIIIGAIFFVTWAIKRLGLVGRSKIQGGSMDILEALPLGQNRNVMLVRVADRVYLLAQTANQISVLDTLTGEKALELISSSKGIVSISQFKDVFNTFMGKMKKPV
jgi:flagellar biosynthetic protein FliO